MGYWLIQLNREFVPDRFVVMLCLARNCDQGADAGSPQGACNESRHRGHAQGACRSQGRDHQMEPWRDHRHRRRHARHDKGFFVMRRQDITSINRQFLVMAKSPSGQAALGLPGKVMEKSEA